MKNKTEVILLPTKVSAPSFTEGFIVKCIKEWQPIGEEKIPLGRLSLSVNHSERVLEYYEPQHLYFLSNEKIKKGDWRLDIFMNNPKPIKADKDYGVNSFTKKIVATTDESLTIEIDGNRGNLLPDVSFDISLPKPPQSFIEYYIEQYNKRNIIEWVDVEYNDVCINTLCASTYPLSVQCNKPSNCEFKHLKVNPDDTINILPIKESWSRDEVIEMADEWYSKNIFDNYLNELLDKNIDSIKLPFSKSDTGKKWIEENL